MLLLVVSMFLCTFFVKLIFRLDTLIFEYLLDFHYTMQKVKFREARVDNSKSIFLAEFNGGVCFSLSGLLLK